MRIGLLQWQDIRVMVVAQSIQGAPKVIQDDGVPQALEYKRQLPQG